MASIQGPSYSSGGAGLGISDQKAEGSFGGERLGGNTYTSPAQVVHLKRVPCVVGLGATWAVCVCFGFQHGALCMTLWAVHFVLNPS